MKKFVKIICIIGIVLISLISTVFAEGITVDVNDEAINLLSSENLNLSDEEIVNTDVFILEDNISIKNDVNGNVYALGQMISISSKNIDGDIFVLGENVTINSNVTGNIYVLANNFSIAGNMKELYAITENMTLKENAVCRDLKVLGTNINIDGTVNRDLYAVVGDVNVSKTGKVGGILSTTNDITNNKENVNEIKIIEDITPGVEESKKQIEEFVLAVAHGINILFFITTEIIGLIIISFIILFSSKKQLNNSELKEYGIKDTLYGLLYFAISILVIIVLIFTLIGIPVSILLCFILWFILSKIAIPVASIQLTKVVFKQEDKSKVLVWFVSFLTFTIVQCTIFIPIIGVLIKPIISLYGFGYMIRSVIRKNKKEDNENKIEII